MILETVVPALLPAAADGVRAIFNKLTGGAGAKPANVDEVVTLMEAETDRLKALAAIDSAAGNVSAWVNNLRALQRPVAVVMIISGYLGSIALSSDAAVIDNLAQYASMVTFYLFGDRSYMYIKKSR